MLWIIGAIGAAGPTIILAFYKLLGTSDTSIIEWIPETILVLIAISINFFSICYDKKIKLSYKTKWLIKIVTVVLICCEWGLYVILHFAGEDSIWKTEEIAITIFIISLVFIIIYVISGYLLHHWS